MSDKIYNVLFLCTGNSARSIMAEALATTLSNGQLKGFSAGSHPNGVVNPFAIEQVKKTGYPIDNLRSKSWEEFAQAAAPTMDFIITVCDNAAGEICPVWPGQPISAHWGFEDPAAIMGTDEEKRYMFEKIFLQIKSCIDKLVELSLHTLDTSTIQREIKTIGEALS